MNKLVMILGALLLSNSPIVTAKEKPIVQPEMQEIAYVAHDHSKVNLNYTLKSKPTYKTDSYNLDIQAIIYVEVEEEDLGFNTADYLPANFNPHQKYVNLERMVLMELPEETELDFDSLKYLPSNFNPYAAPTDVHGINYMEIEEPLDFETAPYLPKGFNPYGSFIALDSFNYIEVEEIALGYDAERYLPNNFNPYSNVTGVDGINYMEMEDDNLGFNTQAYLPKDFDPYQRSN